MTLKHAIIGNSCVGLYTYMELHPGVDANFIEYTTPLIGSLFLDDRDYVKFCASYDKYILEEIVFAQPSETSVWAVQSGKPRIWHVNPPLDYAMMKFEDMQVHWIHEMDWPQNHKSLIRKFRGRTLAGENLERIFLWSDTEMFNLHTEKEREENLKQFFSSKGYKIFLTSRKEEVCQEEDRSIVFIPEWEGGNNIERLATFIPTWWHMSQLAKRYAVMIRDLFYAN